MVKLIRKQLLNVMKKGKKLMIIVELITKMEKPKK